MTWHFSCGMCVCVTCASPLKQSNGSWPLDSQWVCRGSDEMAIECMSDTVCPICPWSLSWCLYLFDTLEDSWCLSLPHARCLCDIASLTRCLSSSWCWRLPSADGLDHGMRMGPADNEWQQSTSEVISITGIRSLVFLCVSSRLLVNVLSPFSFAFWLGVETRWQMTGPPLPILTHYWSHDYCAADHRERRGREYVLLVWNENCFLSPNMYHFLGSNVNEFRAEVRRGKKMMSAFGLWIWVSDRRCWWGMSSCRQSKRWWKSLFPLQTRYSCLFCEIWSFIHNRWLTVIVDIARYG